MKDGETYPLRNCPNCNNEARVFEEGYTETNGVCFACGDTPEPGEYVSCDQCQELCRYEDRSGGMCTGAYLSARTTARPHRHVSPLALSRSRRIALIDLFRLRRRPNPLRSELLDLRLGR